MVRDLRGHIQDINSSLPLDAGNIGAFLFSFCFLFFSTVSVRIKLYFNYKGKLCLYKISTFLS